MATFEIEHTEGMRWIKATLNNESVRAEKLALNHMTGGIVMDTPLPRLHDVLVSMVSDESPFRPLYTGTGELFLESTLGGYHIMEVQENERWIFNAGAYWASEGGIQLRVRREGILTSFWAGEGLFWYQTAAQGQGKVVLAADGPVEERSLNNETLVVAGDFVIGRTDGIKFTIRRPSKSYVSHLLSGEKYARIYEGTGKLLVCTTPYWRLRMKTENPREVALNI